MSTYVIARDRSKRLNRLNFRVRELVLHSLCECTSQRACERIHKVSNKTVAKLARDAGDMAIKHIALLRGLKVRRVQADETWSFVKAKQKNVPKLKFSQIGDGTVWAFLAICADTKFILTYELGDRNVPDAKSFMCSVRSKLAEDEHGNLLIRPQIVTDGLKAYVEAGEVVFGDEADRAMLIKQYSNTDQSGDTTPASRYTGALRVQLSGAVPDRDIHTSYIERANLSLRMGNKRYTRATNAFSKSLRNHERQLAIWIMYYNYCLLPSPQRRTHADTGEIYWEKRLTPAMELGITDRVWEISDLLRLTDEHLAAVREAAKPTGTDIVPHSGEGIGKAVYWVNSSDQHHSAKVHKWDCINCNGGLGRSGGRALAGKWHDCATLDDALRLAQSLQPDNHSVCKMCIGSYRKSGYRGPRRSSRRTPRLQ